MDIDEANPTPPTSRTRRLLGWLLRLRGTPRQVSAGMAVGVFVAFSPLMGLHMVLAAVLATFLRVNRPAALAGAWVTNPLTAIPLYTLTYRVGHLFLPGRPTFNIGSLQAIFFDDQGRWYNLLHAVRQIASLGEELLLPLTIGGLLVGTVAGVLAYIGTRLALKIGGRILHRHPPSEADPLS